MMIKEAIKLKDIINIDNLKLFFNNFTSYLLSIFTREHLFFIKHTLNKFLFCRDLKNNSTFFKCPKCDSTHIRPNTCKSKFCPSCGKIYAENIANNFLNKMIKQNHRHILFTIPSYLWNFFKGNFQLLTLISDSLFNIFKSHFDSHKIKYFGFSVFFHTFGRDLKFNPHLHIIITEGGFSHDLKWKNLNFFPWQKFNNPYKYIISSALQSLPSSIHLTKAINTLWKEDSSVFFNVKGETLYNPKMAIKYLGRYLARAPIAEYKIESYENGEVTFWYIDLKDESKKFKTMPVLHFIGSLIVQIPPKSFKMVRHYGIYARNISKDLKIVLKLNKKFSFTFKRYTWEQRIFKWLGVNPTICLNCQTKMVPFKIIYHSKVYLKL